MAKYTRSILRSMYTNRKGAPKKKRRTYLDSGQWKEYKWAKKHGKKY